MIITTKPTDHLETIQKALTTGACTAKEISICTGWNLRTTQRWLSRFVAEGLLRLTSEPTYRTVVSATKCVTDNGASTTDGIVVPTTPETVASTTNTVTDNCRANDNHIYIDSYITVESNKQQESSNNGNQVFVVPAPLKDSGDSSDSSDSGSDFEVTYKALANGHPSPVVGAPVSSHVSKSSPAVNVRMVLCLADECDSPRTAGGYCESHKALALAEQSTAKASGNPSSGNPPAVEPSASGEEKFWSCATEKCQNNAGSIRQYCPECEARQTGFIERARLAKAAGGTA